MMPTLVRIPAELWGVPVFGFGWLLLVWACVAVIATLWQVSRRGWSQDVLESLPLLGLVGAAIIWLLPNLIELDATGQPGLAIRGFGVMMLLAILAGVGISAYRAHEVGLDPDIIPALAFWMIACGILGARLFYVIQYWHEFQEPTYQATITKILNATQGGLVVYGSIVGACAAAYFYLKWKNLPVLVVADVIAPGMALGQAIGRIGCFMNGCCYGGLCTISLVATPFPSGSPAYVRQHELGQLHGFELEAEKGPDGVTQKVLVHRIFPETAAELSGLKVGDEVRSINGTAFRSLADARRLMLESGPEVTLVRTDGKPFTFSIGEFPRWSLPIHPTQLYSFIDASLLALVLWFFYPYRRHIGEVFALMITLHPISRILLEAIRSDEAGQFGTSFTISQWFSVAFLFAAVGFWAYLERWGKKSPESSSLELATKPPS